MRKRIKSEGLQVSADGTIPIITGDIKVVYSEQEINTNWLLNQILGTKDQQITKVSYDDIQRFLHILSISNLMMPDGSDSLTWLKKRLKKRFEDSLGQRGSNWEEVSKKYRYILEQIDLTLVTKSSVNQ